MERTELPTRQMRLVLHHHVQRGTVLPLFGCHGSIVKETVAWWWIFFHLFLSLLNSCFWGNTKAKIHTVCGPLLFNSKLAKSSLWTDIYQNIDSLTWLKMTTHGYIHAIHASSPCFHGPTYHKSVTWHMLLIIHGLNEYYCGGRCKKENCFVGCGAIQFQILK